MGRMKITVVLRTYNRNRFLKEALTSISNQSYTNWEVIIFDDSGSTENFKTYSSFKNLNKDKRCLYITSTHPYEFFRDSWNLGVHLSNGDICVRLDDDDLLMKDTLEYINNIYHINPGLDFTYGSSLLFDENIMISDGIISKTPLESKTKDGWMPYVIPNNHPYKNSYYWNENYYNEPMPFTSIIHASRANILCVYHLYTFRIQSVKTIIDKVNISSTLCDDLEFMGSIDYLGLSQTAIKERIVLNRLHFEDRVSDLTKVSTNGLDWKSEIERVRCKVDELRTDGFVSKIIPVELPHRDEYNTDKIYNWIKMIKIESLKI